MGPQRTIILLALYRKSRRCWGIGVPTWGIGVPSGLDQLANYGLCVVKDSMIDGRMPVRGLSVAPSGTPERTLSQSVAASEAFMRGSSCGKAKAAVYTLASPRAEPDPKPGNSSRPAQANEK